MVFVICGEVVAYARAGTWHLGFIVPRRDTTARALSRDSVRGTAHNRDTCLLPVSYSIDLYRYRELSVLTTHTPTRRLVPADKPIASAGLRGLDDAENGAHGRRATVCT